MLDCTYFLYKSLLERFPYVPGREVKRDAERLARAKTGSAHDMLDLLDCAEALADDRAGYAFQLGLDAGLSIAREGLNLQSEL